MKKVDTQLEIVDVSVSVGLAFEYLYLVVESLDFAGGNAMVKVVE